MKIIGIEDNYSLDSQFKNAPNLYLMPDSAILKDGKPFFIPSFSTDFRFSPSIVIRVNRLGKNISAKFASRYYDAIGIGLGVKAYDIDEKNKQLGAVSAISQAFDGACVFGNFIDIASIENPQAIDFSVSIDGNVVFNENTKNLCLDIDKIIEYISQYFTLKIGDYIFTGYSGLSIPLSLNTKIEGKINNVDVLSFKTK